MLDAHIYRVLKHGKLQYGVRYFDLRVNWRSEKEEFWCAHAVYTSSLRKTV